MGAVGSKAEQYGMVRVTEGENVEVGYGHHTIRDSRSSIFAPDGRL